MGINNLKISSDAKIALTEIQHRLLNDFLVEELAIFGIGLQGQKEVDCEPELLALTAKPLAATVKQAIQEMIGQINQTYGTNFNLMIFDKPTWENWVGQPLYQEVTKEGIWLC